MSLLSSVLSTVSNIVIYGVFLFLLLVVVSFLRNKYENRTSTAIVEDFFKYVGKGHKQVARVREHLLAFFVLQLLYIPLIFFVIYPVYFVVSIPVFYLYLLYKDPLKKHRHNGVRIGYEFPHPANIKEEKSIMSHEGVEKPTIRVIQGGSKGIYDMQLKSEPNPHIMVLGSSGSGKSTTVEAFLLRVHQKHHTPFLIIDWSGSYKNFEGYVNIWRVPKNLRVNPLKLRGKSADRRSGIAAELLQLSLNLTDMQTQKVRDMLFQFYSEGKEPTIQELYQKTLEESESEKLRDIKTHLRYIGNKLRQSFEVFGDEPDMFWDNYDKTCNVVELEGLTDSEKNLVTQSILQRIIESFKIQDEIKLYIALDDAYQAIKNYFGKETPITRIVREGRKYGFGLIIATQLLQDLPAPIIGNTALKFICSYHEAEGVNIIKKMMNLTVMEQAILYRMPVGSCFLFDQNAIQNGKVYPAYIQIDRITKQDKEELRESIKGLDVSNAPIFPVEYKEPLKGVHGTLKEMDIPSVSVYRFLLALERSKSLTEAYKVLLSKKWITSQTTIYGTKSKPSILERATEGGYVKDEKLTKKATALLDPNELVYKQGPRLGSEEHKGLMIHTIRMIQDHGNFAFVLTDREGFDVGEVKVDGGVKGLWNYNDVVAYEIQTNAIKSEVLRCEQKAKEQKTQLVFVTNSKRTKEEIEKLTEYKYSCIKLPVYDTKTENLMGI